MNGSDVPSALRSVFFFLWIVPTLCSGQTELGTWLEVIGRHNLSEKWSIPMVGMFRYKEGMNGSELGLLSSGIHYRWSAGTSASLGFSYLDNHPFESGDPFSPQVEQWWIYESVQLKSGIVHQRIRMEQRFIQQSEFNRFNTRLRYRLGLKPHLTKTLYCRVFDELFLDFDQAHLNQNRLFGGFGTQIRSGLSLEVGYLNLQLGKQQFNRIRFAVLWTSGSRSSSPQASLSN